MASGGFSHKGLTTVLVLGVKAAYRDVLGWAWKGPAINYLSNQSVFLCKDYVRLVW